MLSEYHEIQNHLLDGLMALPDLAPHEHSIYRTLLFAGDGDPRTTWRRRSLASLDERVGRDDNGPRSTRYLYSSREIRRDAKRLTERGLVERERLVKDGRNDGPGTPYLWRTPEVFKTFSRPSSILARPAIRCVSLGVSAVGPTLEMTYCYVWYAVSLWTGEHGQATHPRNDWAELLHCSRNSVLPRLTGLEAAGLLSLQIEPPPPKQRAAPIRVRVQLPSFTRAPEGAAEFARQRAQWQEEVGQLIGGAPQATAGHQHGGDKEWVDAYGIPLMVAIEDEDLPPELFD